MADRAQLESWIAATERNRGRLTRWLAVGAAADVLVAARSPHVAALGLGLLAIVAISGFWILASHLADWRGRLRHATRTPRRDGS